MMFFISYGKLRDKTLAKALWFDNAKRDSFTRETHDCVLLRDCATVRLYTPNHC